MRRKAHLVRLVAGRIARAGAERGVSVIPFTAASCLAVGHSSCWICGFINSFPMFRYCPGATGRDSNASYGWIFFTSPASRCLLIFNTTPEFRSATSLTLYSAEVPSTCAVSDGVSV
jgi:hypothetical protein